MEKQKFIQTNIEKILLDQGAPGYIAHQGGCDYANQTMKTGKKFKLPPKKKSVRSKRPPSVMF